MILNRALLSQKLHFPWCSAHAVTKGRKWEGRACFFSPPYFIYYLFISFLRQKWRTMCHRDATDEFITLRKIKYKKIKNWTEMGTEQIWQHNRGKNEENNSHVQPPARLSFVLIVPWWINIIICIFFVCLFLASLQKRGASEPLKGH